MFNFRKLISFVILKMSKTTKKNKYVDNEDDAWNELLEYENKDYSDLNTDKKNNKSDPVCPNCNSDNIINDTKNGQIVCGNKKCGIVIDNIIDDGAEWSQFNNDEGRDLTKSRFCCKINPYLPISSIGTTLACPNFLRVKKIENQISMPYREKSLHKDFTEIKEVCTNNGIPKSVIDDAHFLYFQLKKCKHIDGENKGEYIINRGSNKEGLKGACVYEACKKRNQPRSFQEIASIFKYDTRDVKSGHRLLKDTLSTKLAKNINFKLGDYFNNNSAEDQIIRFFDKYKILGDEFKKQTETVIRNSMKLGIATEHTPPCIASAAILIVADANKIAIDKHVIAKFFKLADITINKPFDKMKEHIKIILDDDKTTNAFNKISEKKNIIKNACKNKTFKLNIVINKK